VWRLDAIHPVRFLGRSRRQGTADVVVRIEEKLSGTVEVAHIHLPFVRDFTPATDSAALEETPEENAGLQAFEWA
jgi:hypothetical protein